MPTPPDDPGLPRRSLAEWFHVHLAVIKPTDRKPYFHFRSTTKIIAHADGNLHYHYGEIVADPKRCVFLGRLLSMGKYTRFAICGGDTKRTSYHTPWGPGIRPFLPREIGPTPIVWFTTGSCVETP